MDINHYEVYFTITFKDGTKCERCVDGYPILIGEELFGQAKVSVPAKRVVFIKVDKYGLQ